MRRWAKRTATRRISCADQRIKARPQAYVDLDVRTALCFDLVAALLGHETDPLITPTGRLSKSPVSGKDKTGWPTEPGLRRDHGGRRRYDRSGKPAGGHVRGRQHDSKQRGPGRSY